MNFHDSMLSERTGNRQYGWNSRSTILIIIMISTVLITRLVEASNPEWPEIRAPDRARQFESVNGLYLFLNMLGNDVSRVEVADQLKTDAAKTSLHDLQIAAAALGTRLGVFQCNPAELGQLTLPVMIYLEADGPTGGSSLILIDIDDRTNLFTLVEPGNIYFMNIHRDRFLRTWSGIVLASRPDSTQHSSNWIIPILAASCFVATGILLNWKRKPGKAGAPIDAATDPTTDATGRHASDLRPLPGHSTPNPES